MVQDTQFIICIVDFAGQRELVLQAILESSNILDPQNCPIASQWQPFTTEFLN